jgi:Mg2+-importing ATPase
MQASRDDSGTQPAAPLPFWTRPLADLAHELEADAEHGLASKDIARRLAEHGENLLTRRRRRRLVFDYLARFRNPLVLLLLVASAISAVLGDVASVAVIGLMVIGSVTLDFIQERRASDAAERLRASVAVTAAVLRDGNVVQVPTSALVPGDVVTLSAGDLVPADGRILEARDFFVRQALLTGESFPVEKHAVDLPAAASELTAAENAAFMGSSVLSGSAHLLICRTGRATYLGDIAASLLQEPPPTAFEIGTRRFGQLIVQMTFVLVLFVVFVNAFSHRPLLETLLFAVALAVGLTPELLPMIVTVTLSRGALRMAEKKVIVKRLSSIQDLGSMDVLCTDKTGTLTEAAIRLEQHVDVAGRDSARVLQFAYLNSRFETGLRSPLDDAILAHGEIQSAGWRKIDEVPFGFERRRVSVLLEHDGSRLLVVKGAPEDVLRLATQYESGTSGDLHPLDDDARRVALGRFETLSRDGFRVLAVAWRQVAPDHSHAVVDDETELVLCGFAAFLDPPKASTTAALQELRRSHVQIKVLTGDNEWVTQHVCAQVGLPVAGMLTGAQIDQLDDHALAVQAQRATLFCRVSPPQKSRILRALRSRGHVVGYMGDGVNDAPSLHAADVGISVDTAVDVAKEAADMILLEHDLGVLHDGVLEGRRTFANVMKYIMMGTSSNFGNMFSMAAASLFLPFLPMLPVQILVNNLLYDASEVPIPLDHVDHEYLRRPHHWDAKFVRRYMITLGPVSSVFDFITFAVLLLGFHASEALFRTGWFIESMATQVLVIFVIRTRGSPWRSRPHPWLARTAVGVVALAVLLPFTPVAPLLGFVAPPLDFLLVIAALTLVYLACAELAKRWFYRVRRRRHRQVAG